MIDGFLQKQVVPDCLPVVQNIEDMLFPVCIGAADFDASPANDKNIPDRRFLSGSPRNSRIWSMQLSLAAANGQFPGRLYSKGLFSSIFCSSAAALRHFFFHLCPGVQ